MDLFGTYAGSQLSILFRLLTEELDKHITVPNNLEM